MSLLNAVVIILFLAIGIPSTPKVALGGLSKGRAALYHINSLRYR
jgi:hypothetical protein